MVNLYPNKKWLILMGAAHLSGSGSMKECLEQQGYVLEGFNVYAEAMAA